MKALMRGNPNPYNKSEQEWKEEIENKIIELTKN